MEELKDISDRTDIVKLIQVFYEKLLVDPLLGKIFTDIAKIDLEEHLPILVNFWESILFQTGSYNRNAMQKHIALNKKVRLKAKHFDQWLKIFNETVDQFFKGEKANLTKVRALSIATVIRIKIDQSERSKI